MEAAILGTMAAMSVAQGIQANKAYQAEAAQYEEQAETARVAAIQDEAARRRELAKILATQQAVRAGSGQDVFSGTGAALRKSTIDAAERDILTAQVNYLSRQRSFGLGADQARASGTGALIGGFAGAVKAGSGISFGGGGGGSPYDSVSTSGMGDYPGSGVGTY